MFKRLFGGGNGDDGGSDIRMPEVDQPPDIEEIFADARRTAAGEGETPPGAPHGRHVIIVTPGRMLMFQPCPAPGSMSQEHVASIEAMLPPAVQRNVVAIAHTNLEALQQDIAGAIPFLGFLMGFAYIGHAVWVFEGHPSALEAGCRDADVLIVDSAMADVMQQDWIPVAASAMRNPQILVHDRATFSLDRVH